jgi:predicted nucleic acid-binding protein
MSPSLANYDASAPIFIDANIFLFHAFDDDKFGGTATAFLARVENQEIEALTSSLVIDEVLFKILVQGAAAHLPKPTIWNIKRAMRDEAFVKQTYAPVLEYKAYLEGLAFLGLNIVDVTGAHMFAAPDIGADQALLITDAAHIAVMHHLNIHHLATDDADLAHIPDIIVWTPV